METKMNGQGDRSSAAHDTSAEHDIHFEPIITLPEVLVSTLEENEDELIKLRAKLFRYDTGESPPEWKERGTGEVKLLHNKEKNTVRVVMRRDKTLKICANHFVAPWMELKPNCGSDRAWVWSVSGDLTEDTPRNELLAIRFANAENAMKWKEAFEEAKILVEGSRENDNVKTDEEAEEDTESESDDSEDLEPSPVQEETLTKDLEKLDIGGETKEGSPKKNASPPNNAEVEKKNIVESTETKTEEEEVKENSDKNADL